MSLPSLQLQYLIQRIHFALTKLTMETATTISSCQSCSVEMWMHYRLKQSLQSYFGLTQFVLHTSKLDSNLPTKHKVDHTIFLQFKRSW